jgi:hypothetical protein
MPTLGRSGAHSECFVGIQTSADAVYHLQRLGPGRYQCVTPREPHSASYEVAIEDALMHPLVSGAEAKRYTVPATDTWLLFPYETWNKVVNVIPSDRMKAEYPRVWEYLLSHRKKLEMREANITNCGVVVGPVYDSEWHRYVYPKNLDKPHKSPHFR